MANQVCDRYAHALYEVAKEEQVHAQVLEQLHMVQSLFTQYPDYLKFLCTPAVEFDEKKEALRQALAGAVHVYVLHFVMLLTEKQRIEQFGEMVQSYQALHYQLSGIYEVQVTTARPMSQEQQQMLVKKLEALLGGQILLQNKIDESVLGGVKLDVDNRQIDSTLRMQLAEMNRQINATIA